MDSRVYIAGKITDLPYEEAVNNFNAGEDHLLRNGWTRDQIVNPTKLTLPGTLAITWGNFMLAGLAELNKCKAILMLPNWEESPGARIEKAFAERIGCRVMYLHSSNQGKEVANA